MQLEKMKTRRKFSKNCAYKAKIVKFLVRIISEHPEKSTSLIFETETVGNCLVQELKWGEGAWPPNPAQWLDPWTNVNKNQIIRPKN